MALEANVNLYVNDIENAAEAGAGAVAGAVAEPAAEGESVVRAVLFSRIERERHEKASKEKAPRPRLNRLEHCSSNKKLKFYSDDGDDGDDMGNDRLGANFNRLRV